MKITDKEVKQHMFDNPELDYHTAMIEIGAEKRKLEKLPKKEAKKDK